MSKRRAHRVLRGGSYYFDSRFLRISDRDGLGPEFRGWFFGFRLVVRGKP